MRSSWSADITGPRSRARIPRGDKIEHVIISLQNIHLADHTAGVKQPQECRVMVLTFAIPSDAACGWANTQSIDDDLAIERPGYRRCGAFA